MHGTLWLNWCIVRERFFSWWNFSSCATLKLVFHSLHGHRLWLEFVDSVHKTQLSEYDRGYEVICNSATQKYGAITGSFLCRTYCSVLRIRSIIPAESVYRPSVCNCLWMCVAFFSWFASIWSVFVANLDLPWQIQQQQIYILLVEMDPDLLPSGTRKPLPS